jgi:hypothetical protein
MPMPAPATARHSLADRTDQGDLLVALLRSAAAADEGAMRASAGYRRNRDRVIALGVSLHRHALALAAHCPEFTLAHPGYDPAGGWAAIFEAADAEVRLEEGLLMGECLVCAVAGGERGRLWHGCLRSRSRQTPMHIAGFWTGVHACGRPSQSGDEGNLGSCQKLPGKLSGAI